MNKYITIVELGEDATDFAQIIGIRGLKRRRNKAKQWYFPHNMDKMPE